MNFKFSQYFAILFVLILTVTLAKSQEINKSAGKLQDDMEILQGNWICIMEEFGGNPFAKDKVNQMNKQMNIDKNLMIIKKTIKGGKTGTWAGKIELDPTTKPKKFDYTGKDNSGVNETYKGIYELTENEFKVCFVVRGERPKEFKTSRGKNWQDGIYTHYIKEIKDDMKPKTIATNQTNEKIFFPDSQKIFLEKLIEIRKTGNILFDPKKNKLNPIIRKEEMEKNEKQNQELKQNFKDALIGGQIKNWQGKIMITATGFRILIGNITDTFILSKEEIEQGRKDKSDDLKANKPTSKVIAPLIYISIKIDSDLDKAIFESLKKLSDYDSIEFSIKKFPPSLKGDIEITWIEAKYNQVINITINSKCLESMTPVSK